MAANGENMASKTVTIHTEYITLGQLLKYVGLIDFGGEAKSFLAANTVYVNGGADNRRGRKLRPGDRVRIGESEFAIAS